jgi:hypothetical protein
MSAQAARLYLPTFCTNLEQLTPFLTPSFSFQSVLQMNGFRSLGDDEVVEYEAVKSDKGLEATVVRSVGGGDCVGSHRRPGAKKKAKKVR